MPHTAKMLYRNIMDQTNTEATVLIQSFERLKCQWLWRNNEDPGSIENSTVWMIKMKFEIETYKDSIIFITIMTVAGPFVTYWLPIDWSIEKKLCVGIIGGLFWGVIIMMSRLLGAFDLDE